MLRPHMLTGAILLVLFLLLAAGVAQREYEFVLESDFQVSDTRQWALFYQTLDLSVFTKRFPYTLLDGQPIVTGLFSALIEAIASYVPSLATALPTGLARDQMATTIVNVLSYSGSGVVSLPEIKSGRIDGANLQGAGWPRRGQQPEQHATLVHPCSAIGACEHRCNIFGTIPAGGEGVAHRTPRHDQGNPVGSNR
jgi:hypothetical protein